MPLILKILEFEARRQIRRDYYRNDYLKSEAWQRKRYLVLKRDNWKCVVCGGGATQVHHNRYAKRRIGNEPINWLISVCGTCHESLHKSRKRKSTGLRSPKSSAEWFKAHGWNRLSDRRS